jgi:transmembrane sensor
MEPHSNSPVPPDVPPAWERDPRVRRALAEAFTPEGEGLDVTQRAGETEAALTKLRAARDAYEGQPHASSGWTERRPGADAAFSRTLRRGQIPIGGRALWSRLFIGVAMAGLLGVVVVATTQGHRLFAPHAAAGYVYVAHRGQRTAVTLPDGSTAILAPETRLQYTAGTNDTRLATVTGEAFFTVTPHAERPFIVRTAGGVSTRVLGTAFDVRRYPDDRETQIAVVTGRVATRARAGNTPATVLVAGTLARVTDSSVTTSANDDAQQVAFWTQGRLIFHNTLVPAMLATLGRWYGYEFRLADTALAASHVSIGFDADRPAEALNTVKAVLGVSMTFDGNVITLRPEHDTHASSHAPLRTSYRHSDSEVGK